jgi:dihydroorotate dehydrogenase electron transfer subunit
MPRPNNSNANRQTIFVEDTRIINRESHPGNQHVLRLHAPTCAEHAKPGNFVHVRCDPMVPMRRPFSIMRTSPQEKWLEILFKVVGLGTRLLSIREPGEPLNLLGPIGRPFEPLRNRPRTLLLGGGVGIPPMIFLADVLRRDHHWKPFIIMGSEVPFPFNIKPSRLILRGIPPVVDAAMSMMEKGGIPSRLTSLQGFSGCFNGQVTDLAKYWLDRQHPQSLATVQVLACGPEPMLRAAANMAREYGLPCQVSLEEFMACAVGGCAGCAVRVNTKVGPAIKRVCVDGPVFDATQIF